MNHVWFNGKIIEGPLSLDPRDRGLLLGDGIFETILVVGGKPLWLDRHLERMGDGARVLGIACDATRIAEGIRALPFSTLTAALRITLTRGAIGSGLASEGASPNLLITLNPIQPDTMFQPVRLATSAIRRNETAPSSRLKTLSYADAIAAAREAAAKRADDALMLNTAGHAASSTIANLFLLRGTQLLTPSLDQAILPGVTRRAILDLAPSLGLDPIERAIEVTEVHSADAVFLTNSLRLIRPVTVLDSKPLGNRPLDFLIDALREIVSTFAGKSLGSAPENEVPP